MEEKNMHWQTILSIAAIVLFIVMMRRGGGMSCCGTGSHGKHQAREPENAARPAKTE
jgi:hypothetical protein